MTGLIGLASGATGAAAVTGFFNFRKARLDVDLSDRAKLWERVSMLEQAMREQQRDHYAQLASINAEHKQEVAELRKEIAQLNKDYDALQVEKTQLQIDLRAAQLEIATLQVQLKTGAGSLPQHVVMSQTNPHKTDSPASVPAPHTHDVSAPHDLPADTHP